MNIYPGLQSRISFPAHKFGFTDRLSHRRRCISLTYLRRNFGAYQIYCDPALLNGAIVVVAAFAVFSYLFLKACFRFGYFLGFYFCTTVLGYLRLNCFSHFEYNHWLSGASAVVSTVVFLIPALFVSSSIPQGFTITESTFDRILTFILMLGVATVLIGATYSFKVVSLTRMNDFRDKISMPALLYYWIGITSNAL
jgi:hypothetical protein